MADKLGTPVSALFDPEILRVRRQLFGEMVETNTDGQGRVLIPPSLREYAEISNTAVLVGAGDWIEVWNPENWKMYAEQELTEDKLTRAGGGMVADPTTAIQGGDAGLSQTSSP